MSARSPKILYVEDNPVNRHLVRRILTKAGYTVLEAPDGLSGIKLAERECPDLILMDIMLPGLDGYQVTTRLKSLPELSRTPIVALTAKALPGDRERALIAGCDGYIPKPIDVDYLCDQIAEFLEGKREEIEGGTEQQLTLQQQYTRELVLQLEDKVRALQKANAELRRVDELKSKFISIASHELRTPLAVIHGYLMMLSSATEGLDIPQGEMLSACTEGIGKGVERLKSIVNDMLDVTRIEGQSLQVHRQPVTLRYIIEAAVRDLEPAAQGRGLSIEVDLTADLPQINADVERLRQALTHLLSNAIKYTPDGGHIRVSTAMVEGIELARPGFSSSGKFVDVVVADTGVGIDPEEQERIFDLFYEVQDVSLHSTGKTRFMGGGLGLGLPIARGIVEAHGGFMWVESEGHDAERCPGSRFHLLLPLEV